MASAWIFVLAIIASVVSIKHWMLRLAYSKPALYETVETGGEISK